VHLDGDNYVTVKVGGVAEDTIRSIEIVGGGSKGDTLIGDQRANSLAGGGGKDILDGGGGVDSAIYTDKTASVYVTLAGSNQVTVKVGGVSEDKIRNIENVYGGEAGDRLTGDAKSNVLVGNAGADTLTGAGGTDHLFGRQGKDVLTGGTGVDFFYFDERPRSSSVDRIVDFDAQRELLVLSIGWLPYPLSSPNGVDVNYSHIRYGKVAKDNNDFFIYDRSSGKLYFDVDGARSQEQVLMAVLVNRPAITEDNFYIL
jgi:Ca2+-binding RTX toxin-like protein